jgi:L-threonylcarbamoyladenylate synthase
VSPSLDSRLRGNDEVVAQRHQFRTAAEALVASGDIIAQLDANGLIAYPTETVYGLGSAISDEGVAALLKLKGRSAEKSFLLLVANQLMIDDLQLDWNSAASALAGKHWPGPLTLVLRRADSRPRLPAGVTGTGGSVAIRWTSHPAVSQLLQQFGRPITSTSANVPGADPATRAMDVARDYEGALHRRELILLDGGELPPSKPSTVIDCTETLPRVIRIGAIRSSELRETIPELIGTE